MRRASSVMGASRLYVSDARRRRVELPSSCKLLAGPKPAKIGPKKLLALQFLERTKIGAASFASCALNYSARWRQHPLGYYRNTATRENLSSSLAAF